MYKDQISAIEIHLKSSQDTEKVNNQVEGEIKDKELFYSRDWEASVNDLSEVLSTERTVMFIILSLIIIVAAFNVITCLFILVKNKATEIAILKTIGTSDISILKNIYNNWILIGVVGSLIGSFLELFITVNL